MNTFRGRKHSEVGRHALSIEEKERLRTTGGLVLSTVQERGHCVVANGKPQTEPIIRGIIGARKDANPETGAESVLFVTEADIANPGAYSRLKSRLDDYQAHPENDLVIIKDAAILRAQISRAEELNEYLLAMPEGEVRTVTFDTSPWRNKRRIPSHQLLASSAFLDTVTVGVNVDHTGSAVIIDPLDVYRVVPPDATIAPVEVSGKWFSLGEVPGRPS